MPRREQYEELARGIAAYLAERQRPDGGFPGPDSYGVACALWLWSGFGVEFAPQIGRAWHRLKTEPPDSHGEFNICALLHCRDRLGAGPVDALLRRLRFGRRHSANWMLLRAVCRALHGPFLSPVWSSCGARAALLRCARGGFIADRPGMRSLTYHAFCGALLADLWGSRRVAWAARAAVQAAHLAARFVLPNGDGLYIGRGQQQIFGYGALLHLLEAAAQLTGDQTFAGLAGLVFGRLVGFRRGDGSLPLVLQEGEEIEPWVAGPVRPGWYSYNRYADYLPFLGCFLLKTARLDLPPYRQVPPPATPSRLRRIEREGYVAVLSEPVGAPTNDLAFPYVCVRGESLFPCYGVEGEHVPPEAMPLPFGTLKGGQEYGFRDRLRYRLTETELAGSSRLVRHVRSFEFHAGGFVCRDRIAFRRRCEFAEFTPANFLFRTLRHSSGAGLQTWHRAASANLRLRPAGAIHRHAALTASGPLVALRHSLGPLAARPGDAISTELRVDFL